MQEQEQNQIFIFRRISELATISEAIIEVLKKQDYRRFDVLIQQSRIIRASLRDLHKSQSEIKITDDIEKERVRKELNLFLESINKADSVIAEHLQKLVSSQSREELLSTPEGCAIFSEVLLPASWDPENGVIALIGSGGATLANKLQERGQKRILIYDPNSNEKDDIYEDGILVIRNKVDIVHLISRLPGLPSTMQIASRMPDPDISDALFNECTELIREGIYTHQIMQNTVDRFGRYWLMHGIKNIPYILQHPTIDHLEEAIVGKPIIMVAPGPSLEKNIHILAKIQNRAFVCCISQSLNILLKAGIKPDAVFAADPQNLTSHFEQLDSGNAGSLVLAATVHNNLYRLPAKRFFSMAANGSSDEWLLKYLGKKSNSSVGGSVACSIFSLGIRTKCSALIMVGQDLAFEGERMYAENAPKSALRVEFDANKSSWKQLGEPEEEINDEIAPEDLTKRFAKVLKVPGYYGGTVPTSEAFRIFWTWFAKTAREHEGPTKLLNCTEGGAHIPGMEHIPLSEAAEKYLTEKIDKESILDEAYSRFNSTDSIAHGCAQMSQTLDALQQCREIATDASRMIENYDDTKFDDINAKERELIEWVKKASFINLFRPMDIRDVLKKIELTDTVEESFVVSKKLYKLIIDCVNELEGPVKKSLEKIKALS